MHLFYFGRLMTFHIFQLTLILNLYALKLFNYWDILFSCSLISHANFKYLLLILKLSFWLNRVIIFYRNCIRSVEWLFFLFFLITLVRPYIGILIYIDFTLILILRWFVCLIKHIFKYRILFFLSCTFIDALLNCLLRSFLAATSLSS